MFGVIVTGHGGFAEGIEKTLDLIMGTQEKIKFFNFDGGMSADKLGESFENAIKEMGNEKGTLILADIKGGTPFNAGVLLGSKIGNIEVIGGCNMPMLIEALDAREDFRLSEAVEPIIFSARNEIGAFQIKKELELEDDGI